jgi:predicted ATP-dependent endonuclease of OLD family
MYIKHLAIRNYRNFGDPAFKMELKPFTLILGENNVGKTNVLNALGLIFSQEIMVFRKRILEIDDINYASVCAFKNSVINPKVSAEDIVFPVVSVEVILTDMDEDQEAVVGDWFINKELTDAKITYQFAPSANFDKVAWINKQRQILATMDSSATNRSELIDFPIGDYRYSIFGGNDSANECSAYWLRMLKMEYLDALRDAQRELVASGEYRLLYRILVQKDKSQYVDIKKILSSLHGAVRSNSNLQSIKDDVKKLLDKISLVSGDTDSTIDFNFTSPEAYELLKKVSLIYGSNPISVDRNGLGRNNLLYIALILSHLSSYSVNGEEIFFRLIAIEEPEAHLHPHLEDHLATNIESIQKNNNNRMQLIMTTHSTHIAAKIGLSNSVILFNDTENVPASHYILHGLDEQKEKNTIHYLAKFIDATKSRMFFARKVILVEGISEQLLMPLLYEIYSGKTLEKVGCNIINANGVAFSHFLKIIKNGFFISGIVFTDSDAETQTYERADDLKSQYDCDLIRIEVSEFNTFEQDLIEANKSGVGKRILLKSLKDTRPQKGAQYESDIGQDPIDSGTFFEEIEKHKSEFAFNLAIRLKEFRLRGFQIPPYIERGFKFME